MGLGFTTCVGCDFVHLHKKKIKELELLFVEKRLGDELLPFLVGCYFGLGVSEETLVVWLRA